VSEDGKVSLFDLDLIHNVEAGALLAIRTLPTLGEPGVTVFGKPIRARPGRAARVRAGSGARLSSDGLQIFATIPGHAALVGDVVTVSPVYHVRGDVGPATGNVEFVGSVTITGNVGAGYRVRAGGDLEIQGGVTAGDVEAAGSVSVRYGIRGQRGNGRVVAAGAVRAKFIEYAVVRAGESIYASDGIIQSTVEAGGKVEVLGQRGSIVGGRILARTGVSARDFGSPHGIPTEIVVGADPALVTEAQNLPARETALASQLEQVQQRVLHLREQNRLTGLSAPAREELQKLHDVYRSLLEHRAQLNQRKEELAQLLLALRGAAVVALDTCHPEVRITVGTATRLVRETLRATRFERNLKTYEIDLVELADGP
jgi:uncharacterized protein (DUF342 family)